MPRHRTSGNWESKFGQFVGDFGVEDLAGELRIDSTAVYHWIRGTSAPKFETAVAIRELARSRGVALSIDEIYGHRGDSIKENEAWKKKSRSI